MKRTCKLSLSFLCFLICFLLSMSGIRARDEALAADIAPKILRFHVLANSDSAKDQALKLRVKDLLLEKIRDGAAAGQIAGKEELKAYILSESSTLEAAAEDFYPTASGMITLYMWGSRPAGFRCAPTGT